MATSPTSKSALQLGAAKDDFLGADGNFVFKISDLLANDPGGAAKVDITKQFFFGDTAADQANQAQYLADHGITDNHDGTYTIGAGATDFHYFMQTGNKGTWSQAAVDVTAPEPATPHEGKLIFSEGFEGLSDTTSWAPVNMANHGWTNTSNDTEVAYGNPDNGFAYGGLKAAEGNYWLDTQATSGPIDIKHDFVDPTGGSVKLSFDIASEAFGTTAWQTFQFKIDGKVVDHEFTGAELQWQGDHYLNNQMQHYEFVVDVGGPAGGTHTLELLDTSPASNIGFAVDNIQIHDWLV